jgi:hypothetical protein
MGTVYGSMVMLVCVAVTCVIQPLSAFAVAYEDGRCEDACLARYHGAEELCRQHEAECYSDYADCLMSCPPWDYNCQHECLSGFQGCQAAVAACHRDADFGFRICLNMCRDNRVFLESPTPQCLIMPCDL